jgi:uncharacterized Zn-binding protein involved in type VI secretion
VIRALARSALAAVVATAVVATGGPAMATVADPVQSTKWTEASCAVGAITGAYQENGNGIVVVTGRAVSCGGHVLQSAFALATFPSGTDAKPRAQLGNARYFLKDRIRWFAAAAFYHEGGVVCLMASPTKRLACAEVTAKPAEPVAVRPVSTDDPAVARSVQLDFESDSDYLPACATCF